MKTFETYAPLFPGFYGTVFEYDDEEYDIEYYNEENKTNLSYDDFVWNYGEYKNRIAKAFVNRLESELNYFLPIKMQYEEISSPKEYNFYNDSINVKVELDLKELLKLIKDRKEQAATYFKENYTSCDGFISFHSNDVNDWLKESYILKEPKHRIGALLNCLCNIEMDIDDIIYWCDGENYIDFSPINEHEETI